MRYYTPALLHSQPLLFFLEPSATLWPSVVFKLTLPSPERQNPTWNKYEFSWHTRQIQKVLQESGIIYFTYVYTYDIYTCFYIYTCAHIDRDTVSVYICMCVYRRREGVLCTKGKGVEFEGCHGYRSDAFVLALWCSLGR